MEKRRSQRTKRIASTRSSGARGPVPSEARFYADLIQAITDQRLRPGTRLNEVHLAKSYGLARPRVRHVLNRLAADSIVEFKLNLGAFIRRPAPQEALDVFETRRFLEAGVVQSIASQRSSTDIARLRKFVVQERKAYRAPRPGVHKLSSDFHILLAEVGGNRVVTDLLTPLIHRCCLIQSVYMTPAGPPCLVHEHEELVEQLAKGNAREALRLHNYHFDHLESSLLLEEPPDTITDRMFA